MRGSLLIGLACLGFAACATGPEPVPAELILPSSSASPNGGGRPVYGSGQCIGAVVNGQCHGSVIGPPRAVCHGQMLNGQCTGPMF